LGCVSLRNALLSGLFSGGADGGDADTVGVRIPINTLPINNEIININNNLISIYRKLLLWIFMFPTSIFILLATSISNQSLLFFLNYADLCDLRLYMYTRNRVNITIAKMNKINTQLLEVKILFDVVSLALV
jgi:hypothetical protein